MPIVGAKASFVVKAGSTEHKAMVDAMKTAELGQASLWLRKDSNAWLAGAVLCYNDDGTYTAVVPDPNAVNTAYLAEGQE